MSRRLLVVAGLATALALPLAPAVAAPPTAPPRHAGVLVGAPVGSAAHRGSPDLSAAIVTRLRTRAADPRLGTRFSGRVIDVATGRELWSKNPGTRLMPASTNKVITAYAALTSMGSQARLTTAVYQAPSALTTIYLRGAGDPSLTSARLGQLAATSATKLKAKGITKVAVKVDDTLFPAPTNAVGWKASYLPVDIAPVRALVVDSHNVMDTSLDAAAVFASRLKAKGVTASSVARLRIPAGAVALATTQSATVSTLIATMLNVSQNDYAEAFFRLAAIARGHPATWAGGRSNEVALLSAAKVPITGWSLYDGSGLSRSDRIPVVTMTALLRVIDTNTGLRAAFFAATAMPVSGVNGTLKKRYLTGPTRCAKGLLHAKTGTLDDAVALAGLSLGVDGRARLFALVVNGKPDSSTTIAAVDALAATTTGCY